MKKDLPKMGVYIKEWFRCITNLLILPFHCYILLKSVINRDFDRINSDRDKINRENFRNNRGHEEKDKGHGKKDRDRGEKDRQIFRINREKYKINRENFRIIREPGSVKCHLVFDYFKFKRKTF